MRAPPTHPTTSELFTGLADTYAAHRPGYAPGAIDAVLLGVAPPARVLDAGAGTGISARLLAARGAHVIGVEPNRDMLAEARRACAGLSGVELRLAEAESTGLPDASVDVVVCAQSFHWMDRERALAELHRVLRPGGRLALLWNVRDDGDPFTARLGAVMQRAMDAAERAGRPVSRHRTADLSSQHLFRVTASLAFDNPQRCDLDGLLGRARSASYFPRQGPLQGELEAELGRLFGDFQAGGGVTIAQRTEVILAARVP